MRLRKSDQIATLRLLLGAVFLVALTAPEAGAAPEVRSGRATRPRVQFSPSVTDNSAHMDVNKLDMIVTNHASFAYDLEVNNGGLFYPKGSLNTALFAAGMWLGAKVGGQVRVAIGDYAQEFVPGPMSGGTFQSDIPRFRSYELLRGADGNIDTTTADYAAWPVQDGAPLDTDGRPLLIGDKTVWSVFNDADPTSHTGTLSGGTSPLGVEVQQTTFAFNRTGPLQNIIFVKFKMINKGANNLDEMYVSVWSDPDLGGFTDDLVGCDTLLSLGYCYNANNSDAQYGAAPPAVGFDFFRGPIVQVSPGVFDTLGMTSFNKYINGTDPLSPAHTYNYMSGLNRDGSQIHEFDNTGLPVTTFQVSGDPVAGTGWLDTNASDRRLLLTTGPFNMAVGDTQEVVTAVIIGQGGDRLTSVSDLKAKDQAAQLAFDSNFVLPPPMPTPSLFAQPSNRAIRLEWGSEPVGFVGTGSGKENVFEGFKVYQFSRQDPDADRTLVATYDLANGITKIFQDINDPETGTKSRVLKASGNDTGLQFSLDLTTDFVNGGRLVNYKDYFYTVTGYGYDVNNVGQYLIDGAPIGIVSELDESSIDANTIVKVSPQQITAQYSLTGTHVSGPAGNGTVVVEQPATEQGQLTGDLYRITFDDQELWTLQNVTTGTVLLSNQANLDGTAGQPVTEGFIAGVEVNRTVSAVNEVFPGGVLHNIAPERTDSTGVWYFSTLGAPTLARLVRFRATGHDYEIRVLADTTEYAWEFTGDDSPVLPFKVPVEIWDLGLNSITNTGDDVKISAMVLDNDTTGPNGGPNGAFNWGDGVYFREIPYATVSWTTPGIMASDYVPDGSDMTLGRFFFELGDTTFLPEQWPDPTAIRVETTHFSSADQFEFRTAPLIKPGAAGKEDLKKILAVPNPYYARSSYDVTQFNRVMKFTAIPASRKVTIRIFTLAGTLVRTLRAEPNSADVSATSTMTWDLQNENRLPVASGIYIYVVDVEGVGTKTDRIAVFREEERLDYF